MVAKVAGWLRRLSSVLSAGQDRTEDAGVSGKMLWSWTSITLLEENTSEVHPQILFECWLCAILTCCSA